MKLAARTAIGLAVAGLVLAGCGGSTGSNGSPTGPNSPSSTVRATIGPDGIQSVRIEGTDALAFTPKTIQAQVGQLRIIFTTTGGTPHTLDVTSLHRNTGNVAHNQTKTLSINLPRPGTYRFICDYHANQGMTGTIIAR